MIERKWPTRLLGSCVGVLLALGQGAVLAQTPTLPGAMAPATAAPQEIRAQLTPRDYTTLASEIAARIDRIAARPGEPFKQGAFLVTFHSRVQRPQAATAPA